MSFFYNLRWLNWFYTCVGLVREVWRLCLWLDKHGISIYELNALSSASLIRFSSVPKVVPLSSVHISKEGREGKGARWFWRLFASSLIKITLADLTNEEEICERILTWIEKIFKVVSSAITSQLWIVFNRMPQFIWTTRNRSRWYASQGSYGDYNNFPVQFKQRYFLSAEEEMFVSKWNPFSLCDIQCKLKVNIEYQLACATHIFY